MADVLSRRYTLLATLDVRLLGFESMKSYYENDADFAELFKKCVAGPNGEFLLQDGFYSRATNFVCPNMQFESFWCVKLMVVV